MRSASRQYHCPNLLRCEELTTNDDRQKDQVSKQLVFTSACVRHVSIPRCHQLWGMRGGGDACDLRQACASSQEVALESSAVVCNARGNYVAPAEC
jgi:hypothetical protein